jgi:hypothetical protein
MFASRPSTLGSSMPSASVVACCWPTNLLADQGPQSSAAHQESEQYARGIELIMSACATTLSLLYELTNTHASSLSASCQREHRCRCCRR